MALTPDILNWNLWSWGHIIALSKISTGNSDDQPSWEIIDRGKISSLSLVKRNDFTFT